MTEDFLGVGEESGSIDTYVSTAGIKMQEHAHLKGGSRHVLMCPATPHLQP